MNGSDNRFKKIVYLYYYFVVCFWTRPTNCNHVACGLIFFSSPCNQYNVFVKYVDIPILALSAPIVTAMGWITLWCNPFLCKCHVTRITKHNLLLVPECTIPWLISHQLSRRPNCYANYNLVTIVRPHMKPSSVRQNLSPMTMLESKYNYIAKSVSSQDVESSIRDNQVENPTTKAKGRVIRKQVYESKATHTIPRQISRRRQEKDITKMSDGKNYGLQTQVLCPCNPFC